MRAAKVNALSHNVELKLGVRFARMVYVVASRAFVAILPHTVMRAAKASAAAVVMTPTLAV